MKNFPYTGEYIFRGMADNNRKVYIDNDLIIDTRAFRGNPRTKDVVKKTIQEGVHRIKIDLINFPIKAKPKPKPTSSVGRVPVKFDVYGQGSKSTQLITYVFTSEDGKDSFTFRPRATSGGKYSYSRTENVLPNTNYRVKAATSGRSDSSEYEYPIEFDGLNSRNNPIEVSGKNSRNQNNTLKLKMVMVVMLMLNLLSHQLLLESVQNFDDGRKLLTKGKGNVTIRLKYDDNPNYAGELSDQLQLEG